MACLCPNASQEGARQLLKRGSPSELRRRTDQCGMEGRRTPNVMTSATRKAATAVAADAPSRRLFQRASPAAGFLTIRDPRPTIAMMAGRKPGNRLFSAFQLRGSYPLARLFRGLATAGVAGGVGRCEEGNRGGTVPFQIRVRSGHLMQSGDLEIGSEDGRCKSSACDDHHCQKNQRVGRSDVASTGGFHPSSLPRAG